MPRVRNYTVPSAVAKSTHSRTSTTVPKPKKFKSNVVSKPYRPQKRTRGY